MPRPRIAVVSTYYHPLLGGVETHARMVARYLAARGYGVEVLTRRVPRGLPAHDEDGGARVWRLAPAGDRSASGKWLMLPALVGALLWCDVDVVYCADLRGAALGIRLASWFKRRPVILQAGTPGALAVKPLPATDGGDARRERLAAGLARCLLRPFYRWADAYICISHAFIDEGIRAGIPPGRLHYVPHAVDAHRFAPPALAERQAARAALGLPADRPIVMFLGRLGVEKGLLDLMAAWTMLAHPTAVLAVVGPDMPGHPLDSGAAARAFVGQHGLDASVRFLGPAGDPAPVLRAADVFVQPSHYEAFGISVIEAMATGLAVVASGVGGMRDFLVDHENALIVGARDPARLAAGMRTAIEDEALRRALGQRARETVEARFTEEAVGRRYEELFADLLGSARP